MIENIKYKVVCEKCDAEFEIKSKDEYMDEMPSVCPYCGEILDELNIEEIE